MDKNKEDEFFLEELFHGLRKKEIKQQRKILRKKDRSKFKKTDIEKEKEDLPPSKKNLFEGRIISIMGEKSLVLYNQKKYLCSLRGALKHQVSKDKNIIAVGDIVHFSKDTKETGAIIDIEKRFSILARTDMVTKKKQIIAVNIDQVLITSSVVQPFLKPSLIDRFIIATHLGNMKPVIIINKIDLLENPNDQFSNEEIENEKRKYEEFLKAYEKTTIPIISVSCVTKKGIDEVRKIMKNKSSVFSGQSGTGKSSLINEILKTSFKTKEAVKKTYKGAHTTTTASLIPLKEGGFCIDTPGIKSFGLWKLKREEIKDHFPEFLRYAEKCKYLNCLHIDEPECKVKEAVESNEISLLRFESYRSLIKESEEKPKKR